MVTPVKQTVVDPLVVLGEELAELGGVSVQEAKSSPGYIKTSQRNLPIGVCTHVQQCCGNGNL